MADSRLSTQLKTTAPDNKSRWGIEEAAVEVLYNGLQTVTVTVSQAGAAHVATGQVATSTTAATFVVARPTRRSCLLRNLDTTISVYVGPATVTAGNGMLLKAGESIPITNVGLWQVIAASGTPTVAYVDEYD